MTITPDFDDIDENMQNEAPIVPEKSKKSNKNTDKNLLNNLQANANAAAAAALSSANTKQPITYDIHLPNAPYNETHPLMVGNRRPSSSTAANSNSNSGNSLTNMASYISNKNTKA